MDGGGAIAMDGSGAMNSGVIDGQR